MYQVGLTGGIGSGKSTVSALLAAHGAVIIDYDLLAREAVEPGTPALAAIRTRFGPSVIGPDGALDRPALGAIVFADDEARSALEGITHPAIRELALARMTGLAEDSVVVHDHPLLVEMGMAEACDLVVVVDVPEDVQVERLVALRGMTDADARARLAAQSSRSDRLAAADVVIDNAGTEARLEAEVARLWDRITAS